MKTQFSRIVVIGSAIYWAFSSEAQLPTIDTPPQSKAVIAGVNVVFSVAASGASVPDLPQVESGTIKLWLRADAGVTSSSNRVSQWADQSIHANHAFQTNVNQQPLLIPAAVPVSGRPAVRFDGIQDGATGDWLHGLNEVGISAAYTSFLVYSRANQTIAEQIMAAIGIPGQGGGLRSHFLRDAGEMAFAAWSNDYGTGHNIPADSYRIWTDRLNSTRTSLELFDVTATNAVSFALPTGGLSTPGAGYYVGGLAAAARNFQGDISEFIIYQGALSDPDRLSVQNYLKLKYFQAGVPGGGTLSYQWRFNGTNLAGATNMFFTITNAQSSHAGSYTTIVSNNFGGIETTAAFLTVNIPPSISAQPENQAVLPGTNASFSVTANGTAPFSYQWFLNGSAISDATNSVLVINAVQMANVGNYFVAVSNLAGVKFSESAALQIPVMPSIVSQTGDRTELAGANITLSVTAEAVFPEVTSGDLRLWLRADQGVILDNGHVTEWRDQSTNANHAVQTNVLNQPLFISSAAPISGKPTVRFDGIQDGIIGDWLHGASDVGIPADYTSFLVYRRENRTVAEQVLAAFGVPDQDRSLRSYLLRDAGEMAFATWRNDYGTGHNIPADTYRIWTDRMNGANTLLELFDVTATNAVSFALTTGGMGTPGVGYYLGGLDAYARNFEGDISELIVFQKALSDPDRLAVEEYLKMKYFSGLPENALSYQWRLNGTNVPGATNSFLALTNVQPTQSGHYTVVLTNLVGSVTSAPALVKIRYIFPRGNGLRLTDAQYTYVDPVTVSFENFFPNSLIFYTLDGSAPGFASESYIGPFTLTNSATVRAIIYSADFMNSGESDPVTISIVPTYTLSIIPGGGGNITIDGTNPFASNTVVSVTANASDGWTFLQWLGDATGTNASTSVTMTRDKSVRAVFGTTLSTTAAGGGTVLLSSSSAFYPFGTEIGITAVPDLGNFFGIWGNAASGNTNPLQFRVIAPNVTISSLFAPLSSGKFALTVSTHGSGRVTSNPRANNYNNGQNITLTATPDAGQTFTGWSGDASGAANPLNVTMNQSKTITANFTKLPRLTAELSLGTLNSEGLQLILIGQLGEIYSLQTSTNLINWADIATLTNLYGTVKMLDLPATNSNQQFYRAMQP